MAQDISMSIMESFVRLKLFNTLPVWERFSVSVEGSLINFKQSSFLNITIVIGFIGLFQQEGLEVDDNLIAFSLVYNCNFEVDDPLIIESS